MQIWKNMTFNSDMWISLMRNLVNNGNQPRNPNFHSPSTCLNKSPRSTMNDETPAPPNHPNLSLSKDVKNIWKQKHSAVGSTVKTWSLKSWEPIYANMKKWH
jgi:hypothetical protein